MMAFFAVVIDCSTEFFKIAASRRFSRSASDVSPASGSRYLCQCQSAKERQQSLNPLRGFFRPRVFRRDFGAVQCEHIRYWDFSGSTTALLRLRDVFSIEVSFELPFSLSTIILAAACALLMASVSDDVDGGVRDAATLVSPCTS
ncbi:MAG: hypothetical protein AB7E84_03745 [Xanthobacteraceae bacterium]